MSPGGLTSGATAVSVEVIAVSVVDEAVVVDVIVSDLAAVPESFAVQATLSVIRSIGTSGRICAFVGLRPQTLAFLVQRVWAGARNSVFTLQEDYCRLTGGAYLSGNHLISRPPRRLSGTNLFREGITTAGSVCSFITAFAEIIPLRFNR